MQLLFVKQELVFMPGVLDTGRLEKKIPEQHAFVPDGSKIKKSVSQGPLNLVKQYASHLLKFRCAFADGCGNRGWVRGMRSQNLDDVRRHSSRQEKS